MQPQRALSASRLRIEAICGDFEIRQVDAVAGAPEQHVGLDRLPVRQRDLAPGDRQHAATMALDGREVCQHAGAAGNELVVQHVEVGSGMSSAMPNFS